MEKKVLLTELVDRGSHLRKEITPTAVVTDEGKHAAGTFWDANKTLNEIVAGASNAQDTLKEVEDKLNKEIQDARAAEQAISDRIDDVLGIDALDIENLKTALEDIDADTGILSVINNKTDKVDSATSGNFAALDANGNLTDSGHKHSDYITQHQDLSNYVQKSQTTGLLKNNGTVDTNTYLTLHLDISGKANITDISVITDNTNGHEYVDFGLPSGTLWATVNIGASSETGYGNYYKYGKGSEQYSRTQPNYTGTENPLAESADTATQVWGGGWHTPTNAQFQELMSYCTWTWGAKNNINGYTVSRNSKSIFLPAGGNYYQGGIYTDGLLGMYWTSTPVNEQSATCATLDSSYKTTNPLTRDDGLTVRAVLDSATTSVLGKTATDEEKAAWNDKVSKSQTSGLLKNDGTVDTNVYLTEHQSLTNYIQKSLTAGLIKNDGTIDTNTYLTQHQDISGKVNISDIAASIVDNTNEHEYVDLGLPSGLCWATVNVGASSESDTGLYFQWADTQGYTASLVGTGNGKKAFKWEDYKYGNGSSNPSANEMTKYQGTASGKDGLTIIESTDDAAQAAWGGNWRIPTKEEFLELIDNTDNEVVTINNISGRKFINKTDSSKYIFLPVTGYVEDSTIYNFYGLYWTSSLGTLSDRNAKTATYFLISSTLANYFIYWRSLGNVIRPVISQPVSITLGKAVTTEEKTAWNAKLDSSALTNYVLKSSTSGLIKNDGTIDTNTYLTQHQDISGKANISDISVTNTVDNTNGHDYVEIGGIKWATMNVGATSITDNGNYFLWGDTQGYTSSEVGSGDGKKYFGWEDYKYGNGTSSPGAAGMTKYNSTDNKTVLDASDDAAQAAWGGSWRMPTTDEFQSLSAAVNTEWVTNYQDSGVAGLVCTDKTDNSKVLFFPACGLFSNGSVIDAGSYGYYWSSSFNGSIVQQSFYLFFYDSNVNWQGSNFRSFGYPVRGVLDGQATSTTTTLGKTVTDAEKSAWNAKLDSSALTNYVLKSSTAGLLKNDGTVDTNTYLTEHLDISGKANVSHTHTTADVTDLVLHIEYTNGHEYVDLGLPSGKLWAKHNVNSTTPSGLGDAFQWGATSAYEGTDNYYTGSPTANNTLPLENDTAHVIMGGGWRTPTSSEWSELFSNTTQSITYSYSGGHYWYYIYCYNLTDHSKYIVIPLGGTYDELSHSFNLDYTNYTEYQTSLFGSSDQYMRKERINVPSSALGSVSYDYNVYGNKASLYYVRGILDMAEEDKSKYVLTSEKGASRGVAPLEYDRKIKDIYLPDSVKNIGFGYYYNGDFYSSPIYESGGSVVVTSADMISPIVGRLYMDLTTRTLYIYTNSYDKYVIIGSNHYKYSINDNSYILQPDRYGNIIWTITQDDLVLNLHFGSGFSNGHTIRVIAKASSLKTVKIKHDGTNYVCPTGADITLTIPAGGYVIVDFYKADNIVYAIPHNS